MNELMQNKIDFSKLSWVEKEIAQRFFDQVPNPICMNGNCAESATRFSFEVVNSKEIDIREIDYCRVYIKAYCNHHAGLIKAEKFLN